MTVAAATPEDAKRVWESMSEPSVRLVAKKLEAEGKPVSKSAISRWKAAGWKADPPAVTPNTPEQIIEANAPALPAPPLEVEPTPDTEPSSSMVERACREAAHTATSVLNRIKSNPFVYLDQPKEFAALMGASGELIEQATNGLKQLQAILGTGSAVIDATPNPTLRPPEHDPLREAIEAWKNAGRPATDVK